MLVLSRKRDESIMIGDGIEITIVEIRGDKVRLGTKCDKSISVHRREVWEAIQRGDPPKITAESIVCLPNLNTTVMRNPAFQLVDGPCMHVTPPRPREDAAD